MFKSKLNDNPETSRVGKRWLPEEDEQLLKEIEDNKTYEEIALEHQRTVTGVKSRVVSIIIFPLYKNENNQSNIDNLAIKFNIEHEILEKYINKLETNNAVKTSIIENKPKEKTEPKKIYTNTISLMVEKITLLENKMLIIEEKLNLLLLQNDITK